MVNGMKLFLEAITKYLIGLILVFILLFIPAGSFNYYNGWLFMGLLFIPMFIAGIVMLIKNPELLKNRLNAKEKEKDQKEVLIISGLMFIFGFVIAGLNYRYKWMELPNIYVIISSIMFIISYVLYAEVLRENSYLLRTIEVKKNQKLVDTGLYGVVRHPMYLITLTLFLSMPLILGSPISFIIFFIYPFIIVRRIKNEEIILERDLK
ncbi:MAG: isoprenylcysteine carboxylmethyltransferase family protein [Bacilli bacterium]|nr:isoprenylcysteine carboxylmethyltransferase family protein [Bacilli bacterium]